MSWKESVKNSERSTGGAGGGFAPIPEGWYKVSVEEAKIIESSDDGAEVKPHVAWKFKILQGEYLNRFIWCRSYLTEKAYPIIRRTLEDGADYKIDSPDDFEAALEDFVEKPWIIEFSRNEKTGQDGKPRFFYQFNSLHAVEEEIPF